MSHLSEVFSIALREVVEQDGGETYARLYEAYMGLRRAPPTFCGMAPAWVPREEIQTGSSLADVLARGVLRIGAMADHPPYYLGKGRGFEVELAERAIARIARFYDQALTADWVEVSVQTAGDGQETNGIFDAMKVGLSAGTYDLVLAGAIDTHDPTLYLDIAWTWPTIHFYWSVVYTGRAFDAGDAGVSDLPARLDRATTWTLDDLIDFLARARGALLVSSDDGPSQTATERLRDCVRARGGSVYAATATIDGLGETIQHKYAHFIVGDAIALSSSTRGIPGVRFLGVHVWDDTFFVRGFTRR